MLCGSQRLNCPGNPHEDRSAHRSIRGSGGDHQPVCFSLLHVLFYAIDWLFTGPTASAWFFTIRDCVLCYLPAVLTGLIFAHMKGFYRPIGHDHAVGVIGFWVLFLGFGAMGWPTAFWSVGQGRLVPWPFDYWAVDDCFPSLFVLLSTAFVAELGVDWRFRPRHEARWLLRCF